MDKNASYLILAFVTLIVGASLITVVATSEQDIAALTKLNNEQINIATIWQNTTHYNPATTINSANYYINTAAEDKWKIDNSDCDVVARALGNTTADWTVTTDYAVSALGVVSLPAGINASHGQATANMLVVRAADNLTYLDYNYCADDFTNATWARNVLDIVVGFFALALLAMSITLFYVVLRNEGLTNI